MILIYLGDGPVIHLSMMPPFLRGDGETGLVAQFRKPIYVSIFLYDGWS